MSNGYRAGKLFFNMNRDPQLHGRYQADREAVMAEYKLPEDEKQAIRNGDVVALYQMGINPYLMVGAVRFLAPAGAAGGDMGNMIANYARALENAGPHPVLDSVANPGPPKNGKWLIRDEDLPERWSKAPIKR